MISLVFSLAVPWPKLMLDMWSLITAVTTASENANSLECVLNFDGDDAVFFYGLLLTASIIPFLIALFLAVYWLVVVRYCGVETSFHAV